MSEPFLRDPQRWSDQAAAEGSGRARALGRLWDRVRRGTEPSPDALQRVAARHNGPARSSRGLRVHTGWRVALACVLLMVLGSAVGAALTRWRHIGVTELIGSRRASSFDDATTPGRHRTRAPRGQRAPEGAAARVDETPLPGNATVPATPARPTVSLSSRPEPISPPHPPSATPQTTEAGLLASAFRELRPGGNPVVALRQLDTYDRQFPVGSLKGESRIARAAALVFIGRRQDALPLLEGLEMSAGAVTRDVQLTRAELLAEAGRCAEAMKDFDQLLSVANNDAPASRALFGRASCRLRAGDIVGGRDDLERYLVLHPDGPAAIAARRALRSAP